MSSDKLLNILSADKAIRTEATAQVEAFCAADPDAALSSLVPHLAAGGQLREIASLVIYKTILSKGENFSRIRPESLSQLFDSLVALASKETDGPSTAQLRRFAEMVVQIALKLPSPSSALRSVLAIEIRGGANLFKLFTLQTYCEFAPSDSALEEMGPNLVSFLQGNLVSEELSLRIEGACALTLLLPHLKEEATFAVFAPLLEKLIELLIATVKEHSEDKAQKVLQSFESLLETHPKALEKDSDRLLFVFSELVDAQEIATPLRVSAAQMLVLLAEKNPAGVKKAPALEAKVLPTLLRLLAATQTSSLEDSLGARQNRVVFGSASANGGAEDPLHRDLLSTLAQLFEALGPKFLCAKVSPLVTEMLQQPRWEASSAGLEALACLLRNAGEFLAGQQASLATAATQFLAASGAAKLRFCALALVSSLCDEFGPNFQALHFDTLLPELLATLQTEGAERGLRVRAAASLASFFSPDLLDTLKRVAEGAEPEDDQEAAVFEGCRRLAATYGEPLVEATVSVFIAQSEAQDLEFVAEILPLFSTFGAFRPSLAKHFGRLNEALRRLYTTTPARSRPLLADAAGHLFADLDASVLAAAAEDVRRAADFVDSMLAEDADSLKHAVMFYSALLARGRWTEPKAVHAAYKMALAASGVSVKVSIENADVANDARPSEAAIKLDLKLFGGEKIIKIDQGELDAKVTGLALLKILLKSHPQPDLLPQAQAIVAQSLDDSNTFTIKMLALRCANQLVSSPAQFDNLSPLLVQSLKRYMSGVVEENFKEMLLYVSKILRRLHGGRKCFLDGEPGFALASAPEWAALVQAAVQHAQKMRKSILKKHKNANLADPETVEEIEDDLYDSTEYFRNVMEFCGELIKTALPDPVKKILIEQLAPVYLELVRTGVGENEKIVGLCFFADHFEFGDQEFFDKFCEPVLAEALRLLKTDESEALRQTSAFLLGNSILRSQGKLPQLAAETLAALGTLLAQNPQPSDCVDNLVSAFLKILCLPGFASDSTADGGLQLVGSRVPLAHDLEEAVTLTKVLCWSHKAGGALFAQPQRLAWLKEAFKRTLEKRFEKDIIDQASKDYMKSVVSA